MGINANSVKCVWEQYNSGDIELNSDILPILAEDASYKIWEVVNNLKTFTRHSGGKLTTNIVNELLKDCNVAPVVGAHGTNHEWTRFESDGTFFYQSDEVIDLREEYLKDVTVTQNGTLTLDANWVSNQRNFRDLTKLWQSIILAIVLGDDAAFQYTIHTTLINPFIGCILPHLVQKSIEYLAFGYTDDTLDRLLRFLKVLVQNYHSRDVANNEEYFNLSNLFVCLLLGAIDMKTKLAMIGMERAKTEKLEKQCQKGDIIATTKPNESLVKNIKQEFPGIRDDHTPNTDSDKVIVKDETECTNEVYPSFVVNPVALSIKTETPDDQRFFDCDSNNLYGTEFQDDAMYDATKNTDIKTEATDNSPEKDTNTTNDEEMHSYCKEAFSPFVTSACSDRFVDEVCKLIGYLAGKWGYFENETTYLLAKRLEIFFFDDRNRWTTHEFKWLARIIQALTALGETAFRELTTYFEYIPYNQLPEWLIPNFSYGAIYIRGRRDFYFYEYMQEVCGDSLIPFLIYYSKYLDKLMSRAQTKTQKQTEKTVKISPKLLIRFRERTYRTTGATINKTSIDDFFPDRTSFVRKITPSTRRIGFKFAGCRPVLAKSTIKLSTEQQFVQSFDLCNKLNKRITICRRKLLKPIYINPNPNLSNLTDNRQYNI